MKKTFKWITAFFLLTLICGGCNTGQRIGLAERIQKSNIRTPYRNEVKDTVRYKELPKQIFFKNAEGQQQTILTAELDSATGEHIMSQQLGEITVTARSKSVAERNGKVNIDFIITVPHALMQEDWRMVITPILDSKGSLTYLDSLEISGFTNWHFNVRRNRQTARDIRSAQRAMLYSRERLTWDEVLRRRREKKTQVQYTPEQRYRMFLDSINAPATGTRLDTVMNKDGDYVYFYKQQINTNDMATHLKVYFDSYIVNCGDDIYPLMASDTISYFISSFLQFLDREPRYVRKTISRRVTEQMSANIQFETGFAEVREDLANNREELDKVRTKLVQLAEGNEFIVDSVTVAAYASPEGTAYKNRILSEKRGRSLIQALQDMDRWNVLPGEDYLISKVGGEDWKNLKRMLHPCRHIQHPDEIVSIINGTGDEDVREQRIKAAYPQDYRVMLDSLYPKLRAVEFNFHLARRNMVEEVMYTDEIDTEYAKAIELMEQRHYKDAMPKLLEYRDWNTAICYMSLGYNKTAIEILLEQPETANQLYLLAILYARENLTEQAVKAYMKSCELDDSKIMRGELDPEIAELIKAYNLNADFY